MAFLVAVMFGASSMQTAVACPGIHHIAGHSGDAVTHETHSHVEPGEGEERLAQHTEHLDELRLDKPQQPGPTGDQYCDFQCHKVSGMAPAQPILQRPAQLLTPIPITIIGLTNRVAHFERPPRIKLRT
jgi:hypothetical protein